MAIDKSKLGDFLNSQTLLREEKNMWYRLGFYIAPDATEVDRYGLPQTVITDALINKAIVSKTFARNLRLACIEWWQAEKSKPRAEEIGKEVEVAPFDSLDELETKRG